MVVREACPDHLHVPLPARPTAVVVSRLEAEADKMWSASRRRRTKKDDRYGCATRHIMAFHGGHRRRESGKELLGHDAAASPPAQATFHASLWHIWAHGGSGA